MSDYDERRGGRNRGGRRRDDREEGRRRIGNRREEEEEEDDDRELRRRSPRPVRRRGDRRQAEEEQSRSPSPAPAPEEAAPRRRRRRTARDDGESKKEEAPEADDSAAVKPKSRRSSAGKAAEEEAAEPPKKDEPTLVASAAADSTISAIIKGTYEPHSSNHGRTVYRKTGKGVQVFIYFWDERDGEDLCGWWFSPKVGGDEVWAYHPSRNHQTPPASDWNVPHDGSIDPVFSVVPTKAGDKSGDEHDAKDSAKAKQSPKDEEAPNKKGGDRKTSKATENDLAASDPYEAREESPEKPTSSKKASGRKERDASESPQEQKREEPEAEEKPRRRRREKSPSEKEAAKDPEKDKAKADDDKAESTTAASRLSRFASTFEKRLEDARRKMNEERDTGGSKKRQDEDEDAKDSKRQKVEEKKDEKEDDEPRRKRRREQDEETKSEPRQPSEPARRASEENDKKESRDDDDRDADRNENKGEESDNDRRGGQRRRRRRQPQDNEDDRGDNRRKQDDRDDDRGEARRRQDDRDDDRGDNRRGQDRRGGRQEEEDGRRRRNDSLGDRRDDGRGARRDDRRDDRKDDRRGGGRDDDDRRGGRREDEGRGGREQESPRRRRGDERDDRDDEVLKRRGGRDREEGDKPRRDERAEEDEAQKRREEERRKRAEEEREKLEEEKKREDEQKRLEEDKRREDERKQEEQDQIRREKQDEERRRKEDEKRRLEEEHRRNDDPEERARREREREELRKKKEEDMKRRDEELQKKREAKRREEQERRKQEAEEQDKKRREELANRSEEQKKRDAEEAARQEALRKAKEEEAMAVKQQQATLSVLQVLQKLSSASPENFEALKLDLDRVLKEELPLCGTQQEILAAEAKRVVEYAQQYVAQVLEQRANAEKEKKEAEEKKVHQEQTARELLGQLEKLVTEAEAASEDVFTDAQPLLVENLVLDDDDVIKIAATVHMKGKTAMASCSHCADFITQKRPIIAEAESIQAESTQQIAQLLPRIKLATTRTAQAFQKGKENRTSIWKKTAHKRSEKKEKALFEKYSSKVDGLLRLEDVAKMAKEEYGFEMPETNLKRIESQLIPIGKEGIGLEQFPFVRSAVGIARSEVQGRERLIQKKQRKEFVESRRKDLTEKFAAMVKLLDADGPNVEAAESEAGALARDAASGELKADDLQERAEAVGAVTAEVKKAIAKLRAEAATVLDEVKGIAELEAEMRAEISTAESRLINYESRIEKAADMAAGGLKLAVYMSVSEYEALWTEVVVKMRSLIEADGKTVEDLFAAIVGSEDESIQSLTLDAIHAYLQKHETNIELAKVKKLFVRKITQSAAKSNAIEDVKKPEDGSKTETEAATGEQKSSTDSTMQAAKDGETAQENKEAEEEDDADDNYVSKAELEGMTVAVLKQLCKTQNLGVSGLKAELVERLSEVYEQGAKERAAKKEAAAKAKAEAEAAAKAKEEVEAKAKEEEAKVAAAAAEAQQKAEAMREKPKEGGVLEVSKEDFNRIIRMYYKVARQCVLSDNLLIEKSAQIRRMEVGEVLEVHKGPCVDTSVGVYRLLGKAIKDGTVGWATIAGNQGITFLMPGGRIFTCKVAVPLTGDKADMDGSSSSLVRNLVIGEFLEVMEWARSSDNAMGATRIQVRAKSDGAVGWATVVGSDNTVYLEAM